MLEWWGPVIYEYYGATEGGGTLVTPQEWLERPGTVGRAWEGAAIRVLDDEGKDCPAGQPGTVYLKLLQDFAYKGDEQKTRSESPSGISSPWATSAISTPTATCSCVIARST